MSGKASDPRISEDPVDCSRKSKEFPGISVIVNCGKSPGGLERFLQDFLLRNTCEPLELIVVGTRGCPGFSRIANQYVTDTRFLFISTEDHCSQGQARNLGAANAVYPFLLFADPSIEHAADVMSSILGRMEDDEAIGAAGVSLRIGSGCRPSGNDRRLVYSGLRFSWRGEKRSFWPTPIIGDISPDHQEEFRTESAGIHPLALSDRFLLCRRQDFVALEGFRLGYEEGLDAVDFCLRLGRELGKKCWCHTGEFLSCRDFRPSLEGTPENPLPADREGDQLFRDCWSDYVRNLNREDIVKAAPLAAGGSYKWIKASPSLSGREVCLFAAYEPDGQLLDFKKRYLASLKKEGFLVVLILSCDDPRQCPGGRGIDFVDAILLRENRGFDFAAWALLMNLVPSVWESDLLVLANDSVFGPSASFPAVVEKLRASESPVIGLTESLECGRHLQSYFLAFKGEALNCPDFRQYWKEMRALWDKWDVVFHYEIKFLSFCCQIGLEWEALFPVDLDTEKNPGSAYNPMQAKARELLEAGFPFIKVELLRDNPVGADLENWGEFLLDKGFSDRLVRHEIPAAINRQYLDRKQVELSGFHSSSDLRKTRKGRYQWKALSSSPSFFLDISRLPDGRTGWCAFSVIMETSGEGGTAGFNFVSREPELNDDTLLVPFKNNRTATRITYLEKPFNALRFSPVNCQCRFNVRKVGFLPLTPWQAERKILDILISQKKFRDLKTRSRLKKSLAESAVERRLPLWEVLLREYHRVLAAGQENTYQEWIREAEAGEVASLQYLHSCNPGFGWKPVISLIVAADSPWNPDLEQTVESIMAQSYPWWDLVIVSDSMTSPHQERYSNEYEPGDTRIKVLRTGTGWNTITSLNQALTIAPGDFVGFVEQGDRLPEQALYHFARMISRFPDAAVIYCDEDRMGRDRIREKPVFRPAWNPDLFFSKDYIGNSLLLRKELVDRVEGFRPGFDALPVYDLLLRCLPGISSERIVHIPRILYHRKPRDSGQGTVFTPDPGRIDEGRKAVEDYFRRNDGPDVKVEDGMQPGLFRVRFPVPEPAPLVSLVIPTRDHLGLLRSCVNSVIEKTRYDNYEILVINNQSRETETLEWLDGIQERHSEVRVIDFDHPFNFSAICNYGVEESRGSIIGLLNNDVEVISQGWLEEMASQASRPEIGCVGAKLYFSDGMIQHAGVITGNSSDGCPWHIYHGDPEGHPDHADRTRMVQNYSAVTAAVMLVRKQVYLEVGGFDAANLKVALNDVDFCLRVMEYGYRNLWTPYAAMIHHESRSRGYETTPQQQKRYRKELSFLKQKWGRKLELDPLCNRNLKQEGSRLALAVADTPGLYSAGIIQTGEEQD